MVIFCTMISGWSSEKVSSLSLLRQFSIFLKNAAVVFMLSSSVSCGRARDLRSDRVERCFWFGMDLSLTVVSMWIPRQF